MAAIVNSDVIVSNQTYVKFEGAPVPLDAYSLIAIQNNQVLPVEKDPNTFIVYTKGGEVRAKDASLSHSGNILATYTVGDRTISQAVDGMVVATGRMRVVGGNAFQPMIQIAKLNGSIGTSFIYVVVINPGSLTMVRQISVNNGTIHDLVNVNQLTINFARRESGNVMYERSFAKSALAASAASPVEVEAKGFEKELPSFILEHPGDFPSQVTRIFPAQFAEGKDFPATAYDKEYVYRAGNNYVGQIIVFKTPVFLYPGTVQLLSGDFKPLLDSSVKLTPVDNKAKIYIGQAKDLIVEQYDEGPNFITVRIRNDKPVVVTIKIKHPRLQQGFREAVVNPGSQVLRYDLVPEPVIRSF